MTLLTDNDPMPFGRYEGRKMERVPASYLHWCYTKIKREEASDDALAVFDYIDRNMTSLKAEHPDGIWKPI